MPDVRLDQLPALSMPAKEDYVVTVSKADNVTRTMTIAALLAMATAGRRIITYDLTITLAASLLTGVQKVNTAVAGLLMTDRILELQPTGDLPGNIGIAFSRISADGTLRVAFTTPIIYTGSSDIPFKLTVLRVLS